MKFDNNSLLKQILRDTLFEQKIPRPNSFKYKKDIKLLWIPR